MPLSSGTRLGPYEILGPIGEGGMGLVYKARDTRLERSVAIKVLTDQLTDDPQFKDRFEREARVISQLEHPNICPLYDVGSQNGTSYLVMQYLEGETLSAALTGGPMAVHTAIKIALEIAAALDKAHRAGIVHRDLKPGNVMLTRQGAKLLDFGLAGVSARAAASVSALPTTPPKITQRGTILGTFQYMSPEQVEGQDADIRSDIFAFGAVLFEMLTGRPAFHGRTPAALAGAILRDEPEAVSQVMPMVPPAISRVIKTCLAKDPDDRFQTMHDVALQLQWSVEGGSQAGVPAKTSARRRIRERVAWGVAALAAVAAAVLAAIVLTREDPPRRLVRFEVAVPPDLISIGAPRVSPDGQYVAFNATDQGGITRVWVREMKALTARILPGTEGASRPFWSPDSRALAFMAEGKLKRVDVAGGPAQKICDAPSGSDGTWSRDGIILYDGRGNDPIMRVPAAGGTPVVAVAPDPARHETQVGWPEFLPDGRHFLYLSIAEKADDNGYRIGALDSTESKEFAAGQTQVIYAPPGRLLFVRDGTLMAQPFDAAAMKTTGDAVPLAERIGTDNVGLANFSVSQEGTLTYRTGAAGARLLWVDRNGRELQAEGDAGGFGDPVLSHDGRRLAYTATDPRSGKADVWIRDLARGVSSRFTFSPGNNLQPVWSSDDATIAFSSDRGENRDIYQKPASGQGDEALVLANDESKAPFDWSRDGRYIAYTSRSRTTDLDVWVVPTFGDRKPMPIVQTPFVEQQPTFSPDGKFVAYRSDESGRSEIYVQTFPSATGKWQVSNAGGFDPFWRADGKELFFRTFDQKIAAVDVTTTNGFEAGTPRLLFQAGIQNAVPSRNRFTVTPAGDRFMLLAPLSRDSIAPTTVVLNWDVGLKR